MSSLFFHEIVKYLTRNFHKFLSGFRFWVADYNGDALVAPDANVWIEWQLAKKHSIEALRDLAATAFAKECLAGAVGCFEVAHILNHTN